jgi:hypothetical protein
LDNIPTKLPKIVNVSTNDENTLNKITNTKNSKTKTKSKNKIKKEIHKNHGWTNLKIKK